MKTKLLALCLAFPFLVSAQNIVEKTIKENQLFPHMETPQATSRSGISELPDSVYTYHESEYENLYQKATFTYDAEGRIVQEDGWINIDQGGSSEVLYRKNYTYTIESGLDKEEIVESHFIDGKWQEMCKEVIYSKNPASAKMIVEAKKYHTNKSTNGWILTGSRTTAEFDDKGYPAVMIDSLWQTDGITLQKFEISYTENSRIDSIISYRSYVTDESKWRLYLKSGYTYNADGKLINIESDYIDNREGEWLRETKYEYDEKGNLISIIYISDIEFGFYYKNFYSSTVSNQALDPVKSSNVYMDPARYMVVDIAGEESANVCIYNTAGQVILKQTVSSPKTTIPVSNLSKEVCIVRVETSKGSDTYKILVK